MNRNPLRTPASHRLIPWVPLIAVMLLAEWLVRTGKIPAYLFPAPSRVVQALSDSPTEFAAAFLQTCLGAAIGFALSMGVGLAWALLLAASPLIRRMFYPYAIFFQTVPVIAIAPLLVIWFGYGLPTIVAASFIVSVFPVIANSVMGLTSTDPLLLDLFRINTASKSQTLFHLRLPYALPQIMGGFKIAAGLSVIGAIVGEFITGSGLGGLVDTARNQQRIDRVFAAVFLAAVLGVLFFALVTVVNRFFLRHWRESE
jgi:NitT/TauT family transport system permease protein